MSIYEYMYMPYGISDWHSIYDANIRHTYIFILSNVGESLFWELPPSWPLTFFRFSSIVVDSSVQMLERFFKWMPSWTIFWESLFWDLPPSWPLPFFRFSSTVVDSSVQVLVRLFKWMTSWAIFCQCNYLTENKIPTPIIYLF